VPARPEATLPMKLRRDCMGELLLCQLWGQLDYSQGWRMALPYCSPVAPAAGSPNWGCGAARQIWTEMWVIEK